MMEVWQETRSIGHAIEWYMGCGPCRRTPRKQGVHPYAVIYTPERSLWYTYLASNAVGTFIGVIHFLGSNVTFPSVGWGNIWRASSAIMLGCPALALLFIIWYLSGSHLGVRYSAIDSWKDSALRKFIVFGLALLFQVGFIVYNLACFVTLYLALLFTSTPLLPHI
jgi:hypothetical protein